MPVLRLVAVLRLIALSGLTAFLAASGSAGAATNLTTLVSFNGANGKIPLSGLVADPAGDLFGTTAYGGAKGDGTVFEIAKTSAGYASTPTVLVSFNGTDGESPESGLIADAAGDLFGTTQEGGANGSGTVFEITKTSAGYASTPKTLVSFNITNGSNPNGPLIADAAGDLFGTTSNGGTNSGGGTVFELVNNGGGSYTLTTLVSFTGANGKTPNGTLIADDAGDLFGTTGYDPGTVFELPKTTSGYGTLITLISFNVTNGTYPAGALIADAAGDLFGMTQEGGTNGDGTVFEIAKTGANTH